MTGRPFRARLLAMVWGALLIVGSGSARAGLRDLHGPWLLETPTIAGILEVLPSSGAGWWVSVGHGRLFGLPELPVAAAEVSFGIPESPLPWILGGGWQRTGRGLLVEDEVEAVLRIGRSPRGTLRWTGRRWAVAGYPAWSHGEAAGEIRLGDGRPWSVSLRLQFSPAAPWWGRTGTRPLALATWAGGGAGLAVGLELDGDGRPHLGLETLFRLAGGAGVGLRTDPSSGQLGFGLVWRGPAFMIRTSHLVHPDLGVTHRFKLGLGHPGAAFR